MELLIGAVIGFSLGVAMMIAVKDESGRIIDEHCRDGIDMDAYVQAYKQAQQSPTGAGRRKLAIAGRDQAEKPPHGRPGPAIDIDTVLQIESGGNPRAESPVGARGLMQIMKPTWHECTRLMDVNWTWAEDAWRPGENRAVGVFYMNIRIPQMLQAYSIPDTVETRLASYNAGIGTVRKLWREHGSDWLHFAPDETQQYIRKYIERR